ncbi:MAG: HPF/RaiA family ribosome-associated protein [Gammaproteobacteria bacterium]|nr:HPF/RaiA family ribosome-associated protein [Gammaproteobacteria bacterium]
MHLPLQITFRHIEPSPALEARIRQLAERLDHYSQEIMSCRVVIEAPHKHNHQGNLYTVHLDITSPSGEIAVTRDQHDNHAHEDAHVALRDAFRAAERQLEQRVQKLRRDTKAHETAPHGRIRALYPQLDYGRIEASDGRDIYFHRNSVVNTDFNELDIGMPVYFSEEMGEQGIQASSVHVEGKHHHLD